MSEFEQDVMRSLGGLEASVKGISENLDKHIEESGYTLRGHEKRLGGLERKAKWLQGLWAGTGGLLFLYISERGWL